MTRVDELFAQAKGSQQGKIEYLITKLDPDEVKELDRYLRDTAYSHSQVVRVLNTIAKQDNITDGGKPFTITESSIKRWRDKNLETPWDA